MQRPLISIITPAYNAAPFIAKTIESVLAQHFDQWEHIIIDDGSTDDTASIVQRYSESDNRIVYQWQENGRQGKARNLGISMAKGHYLAFLDADDLWVDDKLSVQMAFLEANPHIDLLYTQGYFLQPNGSYIDFDARTGPSTAQELPLLIRENYIPILSVVAKAQAIRQVGGFSENPLLQNVEDYELWLRMLANGNNFHGIENRLFHYRVHPQQSTQNDNEASYRCISAIKPFQENTPSTKKACRKTYEYHIKLLLTQHVSPQLNSILAEYVQAFSPMVGNCLLPAIRRTTSPHIKKYLCRLLFNLSR